MNYSIFYENGNIEESNNKAKLIAKARKEKSPATVIDERCKGIVFENKAQRILNNTK